MLKTKDEVKAFLQKQPNKSQVKIELQALTKRFNELDDARHEYGRSNSILSNTVHDELGVWTHHDRWPVKYKKEFLANNKKINQINDELTKIQELQIMLDEYKPIEYEQMQIDFKSLKEQLSEFI